MVHRTEIINTKQGFYATCSCGWHTKTPTMTFAPAKLEAGGHKIGEILKTPADK